jgi:hypothetical protein
LCYQLLEFDNPEDEQEKAQIAILEHFSQQTDSTDGRGKVWLITARDRAIRRYRDEGRFSDSPDTKQQADNARALATNIPALILLRQNGEESDGWRGLPFWWPVVVTPTNAVTSVFAAEEPQE